MYSLRALALTLCCLALALPATLAAALQFEPGPDSRPQPGVPKGEVLKFTFERSKIFPGTRRDYWVYVPAQYRPEQPACLYVNQDGVQWQAPVVFDNLIHKKEMPVTIGVFVMHGRVPAAEPEKALDRFNRSYEYDGLGENYARFLVEELLPEVETKRTADGRAIRLSRDPNDRAIGGSSSGAVAAFTVAWERPDQFRRVFSAIGTYVGLRGADRYPTLVRKYEPKPLRVFLQGGSNDLNIYAGDWWMANQMMERALKFAGYEVEHAWGEGGHNGQHGTAIFPDAMRWLWKGWPSPVAAGKSNNAMLNEILVPGQAWETAAEGYGSVTGLAANESGDVFFNTGGGTTHRIGRGGNAEAWRAEGERSGSLAFGPGGRLHAVTDRGRLAAYDAGGRAREVAGDLRGARSGGLVVSSSGRVYVAGTENGRDGGGALWWIDPEGRKSRVETGAVAPGGVTLSPDQTLLYVGDRRSHWVYSYQLGPDGVPQHGQRYYWLHVPDDSDDSGAGGMAVDRAGRLYVATRLGVQVCDQAGRVNCILPVREGPVTSLCFGGENGDVLYAAAGGKIMRRKLAARGAPAWGPPLKPPAPRL